MNTLLGTIELTMLYRVKGMTKISSEDLAIQKEAMLERNLILTQKIIEMKEEDKNDREKQKPSGPSRNDFVDDFSPFDKVLIEEDFESPRDLDQVVLTNPKIHAKTEEENKQQPHAVEVSV
jgi:hypothetical protein